jgi:hypothetical protein
MTDLQHNQLAPGWLQATGNKKDIKLPDWVELLERELDGILDRVSALVRQESPSSHSDAVDAAQGVAATWVVG